MTWVEQISNEIWTCDDFLDNATVETILDNMRNSTNKNLWRTEYMRTGLADINVNNNSYDYVIYQYDIRKDDTIINEIADRLDQVLGLFDQRAPRSKLNALQCFVKSFGPNSHYDVHAESKHKFGDWGWIHFLSDEDSGELVFPDRQQLDQHLKDNPGQVDAYLDNVKLLESFGETVTYVGPFSIRPKRNTCILFRTGSAHSVSYTHLTLPTIYSV